MLAGEAVVAIWNGIAPEGREGFYAWHLAEHMPERVGIPGFLRGRRYRACAAGTHPEFFTLYEADTMQVLQGADYLNRLNAPTPWTRRATAHFQDTARALARVLHSEGPGMGGTLLTVRAGSPPGGLEGLRPVLAAAASAPRICGVHVCGGDAQASGARTAESAGRTDIQAPPDWFVLVEATDEAALAAVLPDAALSAAGAEGRIDRGVYRLEHIRTKTAFRA